MLPNIAVTIQALTIKPLRSYMTLQELIRKIIQTSKPSKPNKTIEAIEMTEVAKDVWAKKSKEA